MKALIFIAHGSKKEESNKEFRELVENISKQENKYSFKKAAFLEFAMPSIEDAINEFIEKNVKEIYFYPYFLNSGKHVVVDIPEIIASFQNDYPNLKFKLLEHFGKSKEIEKIILNDINKI